MIGNGNNINAGLGHNPVTNVTMSKGISENPRFTNDDIALDKGYIYLGTYTFVISEEFDVIAEIPIAQTSLNKLNITIPLSRYTG
jgi:hypothetical protein